MAKRLSFDVSGTLLAQALQMPEDTRIIGAYHSAEVRPGTVRLVVEVGDGEVENRAFPLHVSPAVTKHGDGSVTWDWGL